MGLGRDRGRLELGSGWATSPGLGRLCPLRELLAPALGSSRGVGFQEASTAVWQVGATITVIMTLAGIC